MICTRSPTPKVGLDCTTDRFWPPSVWTNHSIELGALRRRGRLVADRRARRRADAGRHHLAGAAADLLAERRAGDAARHGAEHLPDAAPVRLDGHRAAAGDGAEQHGLRGLGLARGYRGAARRCDLARHQRQRRQGRDRGEPQSRIVMFLPRLASARAGLPGRVVGTLPRRRPEIKPGRYRRLHSAGALAPGGQ